MLFFDIYTDRLVDTGKKTSLSPLELRLVPMFSIPALSKLWSILSNCNEVIITIPNYK